MKDVVNIKNSSYKINFDEAMAGLRQYASAMYGKSDTEGVTFKDPNGRTITKSGHVRTIECKPNVNNIINIKASKYKNGVRKRKVNQAVMLEYYRTWKHRICYI